MQHSWPKLNLNIHPPYHFIVDGNISKPQPSKWTAGIARLGLDWYHVAFTFAYWLGNDAPGVVLVPSGHGTRDPGVAVVLTGIKVIIASFLVAVIVVGIIRLVGNWHPAVLAREDIPDVSTKYVLFGVTVIQLFSAGLLNNIITLPFGVILFLLMALPFAVVIALDQWMLRRIGVEYRRWYLWVSPLLALLFGFFFGLIYWRRRGQQRYKAFSTASEEAVGGP